MLTPSEAVWIETFNQVYRGLGRITLLNSERIEILANEAADLVTRRVKELTD